MKAYSWTPQTEALLNNCAQQGMSIRAAALLIGCTRSAVSRAAERLGADFHATSANRRQRAPKQAPPPIVAEAAGDYKPILDLSAGECRWPVTERSPHLFCAQPCDITQPYCDRHRTLGTTPLRKTKPYDVYQNKQPYGSLLDKNL